MLRLSSGLRRYRWAVFVAWLLLLVPSVYLAMSQSDNLTGGGFEVSGSQSLYVQRQLEAQFPEQGASPLALVAVPRADASFEDMNAAVADLQRIAAEVPGVKVVPPVAAAAGGRQQPPPAPDRPYVVTLQLDFNNSGAVDIAKQLRTKVGIVGDQAGQTQDGKVRLYVIGQGALGAAAQTATKHDIAQAEQWNLPVVLIVLLAVFGSLAAAAMPMLLAVCTVVVTMGVVFLLSMVSTMSVFVTSTVSMFGIALAVDYSLFILMRFREELRAGRDPAQATDAAMATSGLAVVLSGLTVIASVTGIYLIGTPVLRSMATGAILTVAIAVLTSTTLTPAVLATFGRAAAKRSALLHWSRRADTTQSRFWTRWIGWVMHRPWLSALLASILLLAMAAPAFAMSLGNSMLRQFDPSHEIRGGVNAAAEALGPGALGPIRILVTFPTGDADAPQSAPVLDAIHTRITQAPDVATVSPPVFGKDNRNALMSAVLSVDPEDLGARRTVDWLRAELPKLQTDGVRVDVGGPTALIKDFDDQVSAMQPWVFVFVCVIAFVMLLISIRSVFLALKGVLMTVLSVAAAYGSLVMVFEWGWLEDLGFAPLASLDSTIPPLVLAMTFGLSMDYEIFLLTRIRERFLQTNNTRDAVAYGVSTSARTITSAALIMIAVFIGFAFAGMPLVAQLGVACATAIAVDATVVRLVLVPALMAMFDQWNWWLPAWLDRILPSVDFEKPLPKIDIGDLVLIPDDISGLVAPGGDLRVVMKSSARLKTLAPQSIIVADPLVFNGCRPRVAQLAGARRFAGVGAGRAGGGATGVTQTVTKPVHPVTMWRGRLAVALDALEIASGAERSPAERLARNDFAPMETTNVQLPTGDRLLIPTGAETLRLKGYLIMARNSAKDYADFAGMATSMDTETAASVLAGMDRYYCGQHPRSQWVATQLIRRLADPRPEDDPADAFASADTDWPTVRRICLSVAVAMLEETR
ncbi:MMPL family transporter [Mycolicibacterium fluoranthenivorans]|uniref:RND superfamily putative drug exporter n=1 Tax=Mycolicibacterium fluoranthenivorans TaxID=258505 RepID=A0A7X5R566_9MYCO|nr:MMPL family transporter [Mycolicibacterium fluoranthenivorans]MCV7359391.1 MMPL family transporter [Mycolicibacterium fluoranthenivorans]NIH93520.1 RND superfamily putative drug exporter [Mycolicibacterium fluoranthenivorans]